MRNNRESLQKQVDDLKDKVTNQQRTIANLEDKLSKYEPVERTGQHPGPRGPMDRGPGHIDRGPGPMDRGPIIVGRGPIIVGRGPRLVDLSPEQRPTKWRHKIARAPQKRK